MLGCPQYGEVDGQARAHPDHVRLRDLGLHRHGVEPRHLDDGRGTLHRIDRLSLLHRNGHYGARHGGDDAGIAQIDSGGIHGDAGLHRLRSQRPDIGASGDKCRLCAVIVGLATEPPSQHLALTIEHQPIVAQGRPTRGQLGLHIVEGGLGILEGVLLGEIVDLDQQIALLHLIPERNVQDLDLAGDLRPHTHQLLGLQGTVSQHALLQIAPLGGGCDIGGHRRRTGRAEKPAHRNQQEGWQQQTGNEETGTGHRGYPWMKQASAMYPNARLSLLQGSVRIA